MPKVIKYVHGWNGVHVHLTYNFWDVYGKYKTLTIYFSYILSIRNTTQNPSDKISHKFVT